MLLLVYFLCFMNICLCEEGRGYYRPVIFPQNDYSNSIKNLKYFFQQSNDDVDKPEKAENGGMCGGKSQSPIDINTKKTVTSKIDPFACYSLDTRPDNMIISNTGETAMVEFDFPNGPVLTRGGLPGVYGILQAHFHWGQTSQEGSEHTVNGVKYPLEMHLVAVNIKYANMSEALDKKDGLAVLGFLYKIRSLPHEGKGVRHLFDLITNILEPTEKITLSKERSFSVNDLFLDLQKTINSGFYRYNGSLTTGKCNENVMWTVFKEFQEISEEELNVLRKLFNFEHHRIKKNFRVTQALNGRRVLESGPPSNKDMLIQSFLEQVEEYLQPIPEETLLTSQLQIQLI